MITGSLVVAIVPAAALAAAHPARPAAGSSLRAEVLARTNAHAPKSQGLQTWLSGPPGAAPAVNRPAVVSGLNTDAARISEDVAAGQSETAIAAQRGAAGRRLVLAGWNDISGITYADPTLRAASITGVGLSGNGGASFTDLVGLPNNNVDQQWSGDPAIVSLGDGRHFIVGSLYYPSRAACADALPSYGAVAVSVATVNAAGTAASFTEPILAGQGGDVCGLNSPNPPPDIAILDKDFLSYNAASRTLAVSYTRFYLTGNHDGSGQIEVVRAHVPAAPATLSAASFGAPVTVWPEEPFCPGTPSSEAGQCGAANQGAYPAVAPNGDVYVAWERNLQSNLFGSGDPYVYEHAAVIPAGSATVGAGGPAHPVVITADQPNGSPDHLGVKSLDGVVIPGYTRGLGNDFPRLAFDPVAHAVVFTWNDASLHPLGDIWLRTASPSLSSLGPIRRVNDDSDFTLHFLPAVSVRANGTICTSWYDRRRSGPTSAVTDYFGECRPSPAGVGADFRITTAATDWSGTASLINPNFGDYTDNATDGTVTYFTWSDGRLGIPQPFVGRR